MGPTNLVPVSAGFVDLNDGVVYGKSTGFDLESNPDIDNVWTRRSLGIVDRD